jgi:WD40 repeat protein
LTPVLPSTRAIINDNNPWHFRNYRNINSSPALSTDGKWLLMAGGNGLMLWDLNAHLQGQPCTLNTSNVPISLWNAAVALSSDGKIAAVVPQNYDGDMAVRFFDTDNSKQIREIDNDQPIFSLAFSPDGRSMDNERTYSHRAPLSLT